MRALHPPHPAAVGREYDVNFVDWRVKACAGTMLKAARSSCVLRVNDTQMEFLLACMRIVMLHSLVHAHVTKTSA